MSPRNSSAAVFDLDRTLLRGSSAKVFGAALRDEGVLTRAVSPVENLVLGVFEVIGETRPAMFVSRLGALAAKGWSVEGVRRAAVRAADTLSVLLQPFSHALFEEHRRAGRRLVLATTSPYDLVEPLATSLGFDAVIATRYAEREGRYTGQFDGPFVWGRGKRDAVVEYARQEGIDLATSYAYSDSYFDIPLLSAVGHPHAVNPDPRLQLVAGLRRWPVLHLDVPPGVPKFAGIEPQRAMFLLARPELFPWVRFDMENVEGLPLEGPAILVANHRSYFDPLAVGMLLARRGRPVRFLGKKEVFDAPIVGDVASALGGIRVERGSGSAEPLRAAEEALAAGELVALMPQGTIPRGQAFFDPHLRGRWGAARLAKASRAPVIPIGLWGTERVWPRSSKVPAVWNVIDPPHVGLRVGPPVELKYRSFEADTERIMAAIAALLPADLRRPHEPTHEELARTYPGGVIATDGDHEAERRPGTD